MHEGDDGSVKTAEPVGVDFELRAFVGENQEDKSHNRSTVSMAIRKVWATYGSFMADHAVDCNQFSVL